MVNFLNKNAKIPNRKTIKCKISKKVNEKENEIENGHLSSISS
jgi:hypothetical protein